MYKAGNANSQNTLTNFALMKSLDERPFLLDGTDVSAKYRGAFCEAKIKSTKKLVKVKVTFRKDATTVEVQDDHVKGPLQIGAVVEIKRPDGTYQEAVINKLTDASLYTVVFDDGDEKTLRRSSLCLKGERHFAESQTLDQLPLTNPEHFGTPVTGKKTIRGRRSNHILEEESSTSSSDEDDVEDRTADMFMGKVVCVSLITEDDKRTWVPALVVSPECRDDIVIKKDFIFVRSFKDGKFFSVVKSDIRDIDDISLNTDCDFISAYDDATEFIKNKAIPTKWKAELKEETLSSESEHEDGEPKDDQENSGSEDEKEVEPFPGECENFLKQLHKFMEDRGTPINKSPVLGYRNLNLFKLFRLVHNLGGFNNIESGAVWKQVYQDLGIPVLNSAAGYNVKCAYKKYLYGFEEYCSSTNINFHMDLPKKVAKSSKDMNLKNKDCLKRETKNGWNIKEDSHVINDCHINKDTSNLKEEVQNLNTEKNVSVHYEKEPKGLYEKLSDINEDALKKSHCSEELHVDNISKKMGIISFLKGNDKVEKNSDFKMENNEMEAFENCPTSIKPHLPYDEWMKGEKNIKPADKSVQKMKHRRKIKNKSEAAPMLDKDEKPLFQSCDLDTEFSFDCHDSRNSVQGLLKPLEIASILKGPQATENYVASTELEQNMNKNKNEFNMSHIKSDLAARLEEKISQETEGSYFRLEKNMDCKAKQEGSSDEADYEPAASRRKKCIRSYDKVAKSYIKSGKRKFVSCGKSLNSKINDENASCKETTDRFDTKIIMSSDEEEGQPPKLKVPLLQKCNGLGCNKQKLQTARLCTTLQDVSDKKVKISFSEERLRAKDPKDVWSSIQGQWPKKTLKELFSDSDTEGASSPHPREIEDVPTGSTFQLVSNETRDLSGEFWKPLTHAIDIKLTDKLAALTTNKMDFSSSGSNSVLNTPPTTPESTFSRDYRRPQLIFKHFENCEANQEEVESIKSESNSTTELDSVACKLSITGFNVSISSSSSNHLEEETKEKGNNSKHVEKKFKLNHKYAVNHKRKMANTSDSEDLSESESLAKIYSSKTVTSKHGKPSSGMSSPCQKEYSDHLPKVYKWSFQLSDIENMTTKERITFLQEKLKELRKHYLSLKSEVASIDRRRKHSKKKEREGAVLSTISPSSNSATAAMLTLVESSFSASSQNAKAVECR